MKEGLKTPITTLFGITHPIILAGMNKASGPNLCAAVSNAGGLGVIGGLLYTPKMLRKAIQRVKSKLTHPDLPFGVDLAIVKVGKGSRKTNYDYSKGKLDELVEVMIEEKVKLFVSAIGHPQKRTVDRLHEGGIYVMNMVGHPRHADKALAVGVDLICAQGTEGGGHTGRIPTSLLIPAVVKTCKGYNSPLSGGPVHVVGAGGIYNGRGLAVALNLGAQAVWVGTRFVASVESGTPEHHKQAVIDADLHSTTKTLVLSGRPLRLKSNEYIEEWHTSRRSELEALIAEGKIPLKHDVLNKRLSTADAINLGNRLMGMNAGLINDILPAKDIVEAMVSEAVLILKRSVGFVCKL